MAPKPQRSSGGPYTRASEDADSIHVAGYEVRVESLTRSPRRHPHGHGTVRVICGKEIHVVFVVHGRKGEN